MVNVNRLRGLIYENGFNLSTFAKASGIKYETLQRKLRRGNFTVKEAEKIINVLNIEKNVALDIFFTIKVSQCDTLRKDETHGTN